MTEQATTGATVCPHDDLAKTGLFGYWICRPCGVLIEFVRDDEGHRHKRVMTIAPATRVLDDADVAALRHLVADHKLVQTVVRQALRDTTAADLARIDRFLGAQP